MAGETLTEPIDALEAAIAYLRGLVVLDALVDGRIAAKHSFAAAEEADGRPRGWPTPARALTLRYAGVDGAPDTATCHAQERARLEARCYGESTADASRVCGLLAEACRQFTRTTVTLDDGRVALLYVLWPLDGPTAEWDPDIRIDYLRLTLRVHVARSPIT